MLKMKDMMFLLKWMMENIKNSTWARFLEFLTAFFSPSGLLQYPMSHADSVTDTLDLEVFVLPVI